MLLEEQNMKMLSLQVIVRHDYFGLVSNVLSEDQKNILQIITDEKGLIPYEKIVNFNSLDLNPENWISFDKKEFYSYLKQKVVT